MSYERWWGTSKKVGFAENFDLVEVGFKGRDFLGFWALSLFPGRASTILCVEILVLIRSFLSVGL